MSEEKWSKIQKFTGGLTREASTASDRDEFMNLLKSSNMDDEIAEEVVRQLNEAEGAESNNIIFIFTEGDYVVTAIHVPTESIDGEDGPVLMSGGGDKSIIAAFSRDFVISKLNLLNIDPHTPGLHSEVDQDWVTELDKLAEMVKLEMAANPPQKWDDLLEGN